MTVHFGDKLTSYQQEVFDYIGDAPRSGKIAVVKTDKTLESKFQLVLSSKKQKVGKLLPICLVITKNSYF